MKYTEEQNIEFMRKAIALSDESVDAGGGPFGAVIVKDGKVVGAAANRVTLNNDPTAHAEVMAIREACQNLNTFDLSGCTLYASCEPCPMCLSAIYWARIDEYFYANDKNDAKSIGFDDAFIYEEIDKKPEERYIKRGQIIRGEAIKVFEKWREKDDKVRY
ncbi:MAG: nucleoside deaminase [Paludibacteraceae bacterium]|nr:nucleoside deaminase [Paludibacteraceae bacterium]